MSVGYWIYEKQEAHGALRHPHDFNKSTHRGEGGGEYIAQSILHTKFDQNWIINDVN